MSEKWTARARKAEGADGMRFLYAIEQALESLTEPGIRTMGEVAGGIAAAVGEEYDAELRRIAARIRKIVAPLPPTIKRLKDGRPFHDAIADAPLMKLLALAAELEGK